MLSRSLSLKTSIPRLLTVDSLVEDEWALDRGTAFFTRLSMEERWSHFHRERSFYTVAMIY